MATNASGSRSYRYGPTRPYIRALRVALADGTVTEVRRIGANKNATGYYGLQNPIDLWIGSEGTLGVVTRIEVDLLPEPPGFYGGFAFFPDWETALEFVIRADEERRGGRLSPRCLELFDKTSLDLVRGDAAGVRISRDAAAAIFFEEEGIPEQFDSSMERWLKLIELCGGDTDQTLIARTEVEKSDLRRIRHAIPAGMNERGSRATRNGGRKVSTDFAVSLANLPHMMKEAYRISDEIFGGLVVAYGHVGNGHPHFGLLAEDPVELARAEDAVDRMCRLARELDGVLTAEHGIGKVKKRLFRQLYPEWVYRGMEAIKWTLDPKGIFSPGNLFD